MIVFALWLFERLTGNLDEWAEIQRGNLAVAALLAGVILGIALLGAAGIKGVQAAIAPLFSSEARQRGKPRPTADQHPPAVRFPLPRPPTPPPVQRPAPLAHPRPARREPSPVPLPGRPR